MSEIQFLEQIEKLLKEDQFDCSLEPDTRAPPFGRLLVYLGADKLNRERILEITAQYQELGESLRGEKHRYARVQFEIALPFPIKNHALNEVCSLLAFLNRTVELPGFELDEVNNRAYYRYVHLAKIKELDKEMISGIIGVALLLLESFSETIEHVGEGKYTFNDLLEKMLKLVGK